MRARMAIRRRGLKLTEPPIFEASALRADYASTALSSSSAARREVVFLMRARMAIRRRGLKPTEAPIFEASALRADYASTALSSSSAARREVVFLDSFLEVVMHHDGDQIQMMSIILH